jgi:hypothetical protein
LLGVQAQLGKRFAQCALKAQGRLHPALQGLDALGDGGRQRVGHGTNHPLQPLDGQRACLGGQAHLLTLQVALVQRKARFAVGGAEGEVGGEVAPALPRVGKVLDCPPP